MSEKVTVTKEVAEAIEYRRSKVGGGYTFEKFMMVKMAKYDFGSPVEILNTVPIETLAQALINGYEVEMTPEDKVREYYMNGDTSYQEALGIRHTLNILGINIGGVNAK